jgi:hypothetical protein
VPSFIRDFLIKDSATTLIQRQQQSRLIDQKLGFRIKEIEQVLVAKAKQQGLQQHFYEYGPALHQGAQTWVGLDVQTLQTPYMDFLKLFKMCPPRPHETWIDLGAGYGRLGLMLAQYAPHTFFHGFEWVSERVSEARRIYQSWDLTHLKIEHFLVDQHFFLENAYPLQKNQTYFLYDFGHADHIYFILHYLFSHFHIYRPRIILLGNTTLHLAKSLLQHEFSFLENNLQKLPLFERTLFIATPSP